MTSNFSHNTSRSGFTLVELSIVLVVLALMVSGVLAGKTMIETMKYRKIASEVQELKTAITLFDQRFGSLPGDIKNTAVLKSGAAICGPTPGNNDGYIGNNADGQTEPAQALCEMGNEGLISPQTTGLSYGWLMPMGTYIPSKAYGVNKGFGPNYNTLGYYINYIGVSWADQLTVPYVVNVIGGPAEPSLTSFEGYMLDLKVDDGYPRTGLVRGEGMWTVPSSCMPTDGTYFSTTEYQNKTENTVHACYVTFLPSN